MSCGRSVSKIPALFSLPGKAYRSNTLHQFSRTINKLGREETLNIDKQTTNTRENLRRGEESNKHADVADESLSLSRGVR